MAGGPGPRARDYRKDSDAGEGGKGVGKDLDVRGGDSDVRGSPEALLGGGVGAEGLRGVHEERGVGGREVRVDKPAVVD